MLKMKELTRFYQIPNDWGGVLFENAMEKKRKENAMKCQSLVSCTETIFLVTII